MDDRDRATLKAARDSARIAIDHVRTGGTNWRQDPKTIDAAAKRVEDVGELLRRVTPEQQAALRGIPWRQVKGMRDRIVHDYTGIDLDILEDVIENNLPSLIAEIDSALDD